MAEFEMNLMTWNPRAGGYNTYQSTSLVPERENEVMRFLRQAKEEHVLDAVTIPDAFRWQDIYDGEEGIARKLGYTAAYYALMDDEKLNHDEGKDIGIAFATDKKVHNNEIIDLNTRNGLNIILDVGSYGLQIANVYLDHNDEEIRLTQAKALIAHLRKEDIPTVIIGDLNGIQSKINESSLRTRVKDVLFRTIVTTTPRRFVPKAAATLNQRLAIPYITANGFMNADPLSRPTWPSRLPIVEIDYIMHSENIISSDTKVLNPEISDHRPVVTNIKL